MSLKGKEILVIDDDTQYQLFIKNVLGNLGLSISQAVDYDDAIKKASQVIPHLIITDIKLEGEKSGLDIQRYFKSDPRFKNIPLLVITADATKQTIFQSLALGAEEYMLKPIMAKEIIQKIRRCFLDYESPEINFLGGDGNYKPEFKMAFENKFEVEIETDINLRAINELSCILQGPVKFAKEIVVELDNDLLSKINAKHISFRSIENSRSLEAGEFSTRFSLVGVDETTAQKIRQMRVPKK